MPAILAIDLNSADIPSVVATVNGAMSITKFTKTAEFIVPQSKKKAIWPSGEADAAASGIDLTVRPYTWWIILDGFTQIGVTFKPAHGNSYVLEVTDGRVDSFMKITPAEAKELYDSLKSEMRAMNKHKLLRAGSEGVFRPAETMLEYHVRSWIYREDRDPKLPPHGQFPPKFRSAGAGSGSK